FLENAKKREEISDNREKLMEPLKTKKKVLKTALTRLGDKVASAIKDADSIALRLFDSKTSDLLNDFKLLFDSIFVTCKPEELDDFIKEKETIDDSIDELRLNFNRKMNKTYPEHSISSVSNCNASVLLDVKLPTLSVPTFNAVSGGEVRQTKTAILSAANIFVRDHFGNLARALLVVGSMCSFMSTEFADLLQIKKEKIPIAVSGLNSDKINVSSRVCTIVSNKSDFEIQLEFLCVPKISNMIPIDSLQIPKEHLPFNIKLADLYFYQPGKIDVLLGAETTPRLDPGLMESRNSIWDQNSSHREGKGAWEVANQVHPVSASFGPPKMESWTDVAQM
ncbi:hypothetical protein AVEN_51089-1, partial [Araneus ventricosus]